MTRFATLCLLAIWSASVAAEPVNPRVESDDQPFRFSKMMPDVRGPEFGQYAGSWSEIPATSGGRKESLASFGWYSYLTPRAYADESYHEDSRVFDRALSPGVALNLRGSSVSFYRSGLHYAAENSSWFINVNFRNVNRGSKLVIRDDPHRDKGKALTLEFGVAF